jgi:hypothetical protein
MIITCVMGALVELEVLGGELDKPDMIFKVRGDEIIRLNGTLSGPVRQTIMREKIYILK